MFTIINSMTKWCVALAATSLVALCGMQASAQINGCPTRHFYNNSNNVSMRIEMKAGTCSIGSSGMSKKCVIPPGKAADLHYVNFPDHDVDAITVESLDGGKLYTSTTFSVSVSGSRCYIEHSGSTGNIVLNSDADGDVATCGPLHRDWAHNGGYDCRY